MSILFMIKETDQRGSNFMRIINGIALVQVIISCGIAATVDISGTVKDSKGTAIEGALVILTSDPSLKDSTDENGEFILSNITAINRNTSRGVLSNAPCQVVIERNQLIFTASSVSKTGEISIFSSNGSRYFKTSLNNAGTGIHRYLLPEMPAGIYVMQVVMDQFKQTFQLVTTGEVSFLTAKALAAQRFVGAVVSGKTAAVDTLVVTRNGFKTLKKEITSLDQKKLAIVMASDSDSLPKLPPITDYSSKGPFKTVVQSINAGSNKTYVIFRPETLGENGFLHAPIIFGPGIGQTVQPVHTTMLTNFASHGFVVVGTPVLNQGPGGAQNLQTMKDALTWIIAQNKAEGVFKGKLWIDHVVSMGFSVGGTSAVQLGAEPSIFTVVSIHGHTAEAALHGPMLQTTGTKDNVGMPLQQATYDKSKVQTFMATLSGAAHQYIESNGGGEERKAIVAWMRYWVYNDTGARNFFWGNDCVLCKSPWQNPQRKNWQ